ncbi:MAG TPA: phage tail sheath protein [Blastocatellia bacterium]|nr:phage tail sheath protein [Blastocatellia bacterium]
MNGLVFETQSPIVAPDPNRSDIACFVGFIGRRNTSLPGELERWLDEQGLASGPYARPSFEELLDIPVPIDTWEVFDHLFEWDRRPVGSIEGFAATYLGAAVRSFFAQGGRKCYVVRAGDPWPLTGIRLDDPVDLSADGKRALRTAAIMRLIPGYTLLPEAITSLKDVPPEAVNLDRGRLPSSPADRSSWRGIAHLFGLPDVSFLCLPDLADAVSVERGEIERDVPVPELPEGFVECSEPVPPPPSDSLARGARAPRCDEAGYADWGRAVNHAARLIAQHRREVQLVAAVPIPQPGTPPERNLHEFLAGQSRGLLGTPVNAAGQGLSSAFVQLVYPWTRSGSSAMLPERLESPDAVLCGILARNALARGTFRSAAGLHLGDVYDVFPLLSREQMLWTNGAGRRSFIERVSVFGPTPRGLEVLSDVTTTADESYRSAGVNRLVSVIVRAARRIGEDSVFESSGEELWGRIRQRLSLLLDGLLADGALRGASPEEAYEVRCDRSTMSQNDIDNGRVIVRVQFAAAFPIDRITVVLAMDEGGQTSLISTRSAGQEAA